SACHRRDRRRGRWGLGRGGARHLGQAVGLASALRNRAARADRARIAAGAARPGAAGARCRDRLYDRRRGSRPARSDARHRRGLGARARARRLGRLGLAVQAYQKRALPLVDWLADVARRAKRRLMVRLVKGAYWDTEIKRAQERGLDGYPVFTRKLATDVSYLACAKQLLAAGSALYPQFATHNAHSLAATLEF